MEDQRILSLLEEIRNLQLLSAKEMLTVGDLALLTGFKETYIRKMVELGTIPCYRPFGKQIFFSKEEITKLLKQKREESVEEIVERVTKRRKI